MALTTKISTAARLAIRSQVAVGSVRWQSGGRDDYGQDMFADGPSGGAPSGYGGDRRGGSFGRGGGGGFGGQGQGGFGRGYGSGGGFSSGGRGGGFGGPRPPRAPMPEVPMPDEPPFRLFFRNLNYDATDQDIRSFLGDIETVDIHVPKNEFGLSRGFGFVEVGSKEDAQKVLDELDGKDMLGRQVNIRVAAPRANRGGGNDGGFRGAPGSDGL